ncbi:MAG TPA: hypothetical protein VJV78_26965 [Polyangiales bacterium]|nr:hypothetical protein [Polyangiales bacterium]
MSSAPARARESARVRRAEDVSSVSTRRPHASQQPAPVYQADDFEHSVHLDAQGNILAGNGSIEEVASLAAYACRIASLIGSQLGLGEVTGIETTLGNGVYLLQRDIHGEIVCVKPRPHLNLVLLRAQLNL